MPSAILDRYLQLVKIPSLLGLKKKKIHFKTVIFQNTLVAEWYRGVNRSGVYSRGTVFHPHG
jgi:hypothetical protein